MLGGGGVAGILPNGHQGPDVLQHPPVQKPPSEYLHTRKEKQERAYGRGVGCGCGGTTAVWVKATKKVAEVVVALLVLLTSLDCVCALDLSFSVLRAFVRSF